MITYEILEGEHIKKIGHLCNALMTYQKSVAHIAPERFDTMSFETRLVPSYNNARENQLIAVKEGDNYVGYVYSNISHKSVYDNAFATFFDMDSVSGDYVGCLSQFYLEDAYRGQGIGSELYRMAREWMDGFVDVKDLFIYVSNGNTPALEFYKSKGFKVSHDILDGFITVLRK
ncbi:MAG TPA: GNAT family N-acetyltransferase [Clostridiales bacterium UBA8960]|nr:GNAT family N-acetyltransferase [Clostridiales bacterium UBA8960]